MACIMLFSYMQGDLHFLSIYELWASLPEQRPGYAWVYFTTVLQTFTPLAKLFIKGNSLPLYSSSTMISKRKY